MSLRTKLGRWVPDVAESLDAGPVDDPGGQDEATVRRIIADLDAGTGTGTGDDHRPMRFGGCSTRLTSPSSYAVNRSGTPPSSDESQRAPQDLIRREGCFPARQALGSPLPRPIRGWSARIRLSWPMASITWSFTSRSPSFGRPFIGRP